MHQNAAGDLDSNAFDSRSYSEALIETAPLERLLETACTMQAQVNSSKFEIQDLVTNNYQSIVGVMDAIKGISNMSGEILNELESLKVELDHLITLDQQIPIEPEKILADLNNYFQAK